MIESLSKRVKLDLPYESAIERVTEALMAEGFGVLTTIDVSTTLKSKLDVDFQPYVILGACNPELALQALRTELDVGLLMPCNVLVYQDGNASAVSIVDPVTLLDIASMPELDAVASEAEARLNRVVESLRG